MTIKDKYGLNFIDWPNPDGTIRKVCKTDVVDINSELQIINFMDLKECESLLAEIENARAGKYFEELFTADFSSTSDSLRLIPPDIIVSERLIVPMDDMKRLLQEWIAFIE